MSVPPAVPRLLASRGPTLVAHLDQFGKPPRVTAQLIVAVNAAGLSGRGGGGFPTGRKMAAITGRKPVVVGNGAEGEPLSRKDFHLLTEAPHLVLDGLSAAAAAVAAHQVYLYLHAEAAPAVRAALAERRSAGMDSHRVAVVEAPDRFVAGEESAAIRRIEGGTALPRDRTAAPVISGVRGRPTLVNNVETLAHIALIARYGPEWFRSMGDARDPGTRLLTLSGALNRHGVIEVPTGTSLPRIIEYAGRSDPATVSAVLVGGYHGTWIAAAALAAQGSHPSGRTSPEPAPGAGIIHALGATECGLSRTAEIVAYLAEQSARQCGPCLYGLPRLAGLFDTLAFGPISEDLVPEIRRIAALVDRRGSCRHPDGTARMVRSALHTFADDIDLHRDGRCTATDTAAMGLGHGIAASGKAELPENRCSPAEQT